MPTNEPFVYNVDKGRAYYGNAIGRNRSEELWTDRPFQSGYSESHSFATRALRIGLGVGAYGLFKAFPSSSTEIVRTLEDTALPFKWGRTFQLSNMMSNREGAVRKVMEAGKHFSIDGDSAYATYLTGLTGGAADQASFLKHGFSLKDNKMYLGDVNDPRSNIVKEVLGHAEVIRVAERGSNAFGDSFTKVNVNANLGIKFNLLDIERKVGKDLTRSIERPKIGGMPIQPIGGATKAQAAVARAKAVGAEFLVYRFNRLLSEDFQTNALTKKFAAKLKKTAPRLFKHGLGVRGTTPLKTVGRLSAKMGVLTGVLPMAYQQVDWMSEQVLGFGPTKAAASAYVGGRMAYAHAIDALDLSILGGGDLYDLQDWFEETMPGSTSPWNIASFGMGGFIAGATGIGLLERTEALDYARKYGKGSQGFWQNYREAREVVHQQFLDFDAKGDPDKPLGKVAQWAMEKGRKLGTAQPGTVYQDPSGLMGGLWKKLLAVDVASTKSPTPQGTMPLNLRLMGRATTMKVGGAVGAVGALLAAAPATIASLVGLITPDERPEELAAIYSGRKEVAVKKGRFWEFGRGSFEGEETLYYRPHWYARLNSDYKEEAIWGEDADYSPLRKAYLKNFTTYLEEKHYYDRPYPITALPFADVPIVGPILSNTLGRLIKPPQLMHAEEWEDRSIFGDSFKVTPAERGQNYALDLGETPGGRPESPYSMSRTFGAQMNLISQGAGLWGYMQRTITEGVTGSSGFGDQKMVLESFNNVTSMSRDFYDLQLGGMFGTNEAFRRLYPTKEKALTIYNPIRNTMPNWLPGAGSRSMDFQHGDPYTKVPEGEYRLPGRGYEARFTELKGLSPDDYPLIHKFKILADIAPHSREFISIQEQAKGMAKSGGFDDYEMSIYEATLEQVKEKSQKKKFTEYRNRFGTQGKWGASHSTGLIASINRQLASQDDSNFLKKAFSSWGEFALHYQSPLDYLYPLSPESKLNPIRTAVESYERDQLYGTTNSFWNKPIRDFLSPTGRSLAHAAGWQGVSSGVDKKRDLENYFDILNYVKNARLANIAALNEDKEAKVIFERRKDQTLFGMNPYTANEAAIMKALPRRDRDYYQAFVNAATPQERDRILEMVPSNQRNLYIARWKLNYVEDIKAARDQDFLFNSALERGSDEINDVYREAKSEGFPSSPELYRAFMESKNPGEGYADWYRRTNLLSDVPLPGPDWIGWHPSVDLEDVKLKTVLDLGEDMHDFNLWPSRLNGLASKPYINDEVIRPILNPQNLSATQTRARLEDLFASRQMYAQIEMKKNWGYGDRQSLTVELEQ